LLSLDNDGSITASTAVEERGNIGIRAEQVLMSQMSVIATDARGREPGGNITLNTRFLTASGNSDITANAANARGGRVVVNAENVFGTTFRLRQTPLSDITASSELGVEFNGVVELNSPEIDPTQGIEALPETLIDSASQIARACDRASGNTFVATGRGGLPTDTAIGQLGASTMPWSDIRIPEPASVPNLPSDAVPSAAQPHSQDAFTEAQGWTQNDQGEVRLIATVAQARHNHIATFCPQ
jgi:large exoprotein involved in heme utilization and adhesion